MDEKLKNNQTTGQETGWIIDLHHNFEWLEQIHVDKILPDPKLSAKFSFQSNSEFDGCWKIYGTDNEPCLVRFVLPKVSTFDECERFISLKLGKMIRHIETSISFLMETSFYFRSIPGGPPTFKYLSYGPMKENDLPLLIREQFHLPTIDYSKLAHILAAHFEAFDDYSELIQSGMNTSLKIEYRWLEFYKVLEMHFGNSRDLNGRNTQRTSFLENFKNELSSFLRPGQTLHGLMTDTRNGAAHFVVANGRDKINKARQETMSKIQATLPVITNMVIKIINDHSGNKSIRLRTNFNV